MPQKKTIRTNAFADIEKLRAAYFDDDASIRILDDRERDLRHAIEEAKAGDLPAIRRLIADAVSEIANANFLLCSDRKMSDAERAALFRMRDAHEFWLDRLAGKKAWKVIETVEEWASRHVSTDARRDG